MLRTTPGPARARDAVSQGREGDDPGRPASGQGPGERWAEEGNRPPGTFASFTSTHLYPVSAAVGGWWPDAPVRMGPSEQRTTRCTRKDSVGSNRLMVRGGKQAARRASRAECLLPGVCWVLTHSRGRGTVGH